MTPETVLTSPCDRASSPAVTAACQTKPGEIRVRPLGYGDPMERVHERDRVGDGHGSDTSLTRSAVQATLHCLTGCAIGEILGMVLATAFGWGSVASIVVSIVLAFFFGYGLTMRSVLRAGLSFRRAAKVAVASDTVSITSMEIVDNAFILVVPGALAAGLADGLFWWSLLVSLAIAFVITVPVNRWLIARGRGHAVMHEHHAH